MGPVSSVHIPLSPAVGTKSGAPYTRLDGLTVAPLAALAGSTVKLERAEMLVGHAVGAAYPHAFHERRAIYRGQPSHAAVSREVQ